MARLLLIAQVVGLVIAVIAVIHYILIPFAGWCGEKLAEYKNEHTRFKMP